MDGALRFNFRSVFVGRVVECRCNTNTVRVPTATTGGDRGEKAKPRWVGFWRVAVGWGGEGGDGAARDRRTIDLDVAAHV